MNANNFRRLVRLSRDAETGTVQLRMYRRTGSRATRRYEPVSSIRFPREHIRLVADAIHDYADILDRQDRENSTNPAPEVPGTSEPRSAAHDPATSRTQDTTEGGASRSRQPDRQTGAPAAVSFPPKGTPHRAHARARALGSAR